MCRKDGACEWEKLISSMHWRKVEGGRGGCVGKTGHVSGKISSIGGRKVEEGRGGCAGKTETVSGKISSIGGRWREGEEGVQGRQCL